MALPEQKQHHETFETDDWTLTPEQMLHLMQNHNLIEQAFEDDDMDALRVFATATAFVKLFGDMGFDEAFDRYETMLELGNAS